MAEQITVSPGTVMFDVFKRRMSGKSEVISKRELENFTVKELYDTIHDAYMEWQNALQNFENADCKDMVDYYSYRIKASQIRYEYLLRKAKALQVQ